MENAAPIVDIELSGAAERDTLAAGDAPRDFLTLVSLRAPFFEEKERCGCHAVVV